MARFENRLFLPAAALDEWIVDGQVELQDGELSMLSEGRRFRLTEAVRVIKEVSETGDPYELVGRTKARGLLEEMGAEIVESSMLLGDAAYDIVPGWFGVPVGPFSEYLASPLRKKARQGKTGTEPKTDEDVLRAFLSKNA